MPLEKLMVRFFLCVCIILALTGSRAPVSQGSGVVAGALGPEHAVLKLSPALQAELAAGETTFLVLLAEQADLGHVEALPTKRARGRAVYDALRQVAQRSQAPLRSQLDALGVEYRAFYVVNMLAVRGDARLALTLAARPDVARLEANPRVRQDLPVVQSPARSPAQPSALAWGVQNIQAQEVWDLGYTGQGIVVAGGDTGYDWDHPALRDKYRGWDGDSVSHDYNWHDAVHSEGSMCGADSPAPCDDRGHGTHTLGIMVGSDEAQQVGVAPGASWIGCRNMDNGIGSPASYAECFEFFLAPYPVGGDPMTDGDPDLAPHIINNSWICPASEGCDHESLRDVVENTRAAGIVIVAVASNRGSSCSSVSTPISIFDASFSVGAIDSNDQITSFSARGPVTVDGSQRLKPDVSAPGLNVYSSLPGGGYGYLDGTSMAAPHVAGLIALLWSAAPHLVGQVEVTEDIVRQSARPVVDLTCGGEPDGHPNNVYGWGIADALAAVQKLHPTVVAQAAPTFIDAGDALTYTFSVANWSRATALSDVVLSNTLPLSTTFAWASGIYARSDGFVQWALGTLPPGEQVSATLVLTADGSLARGAAIVNADYSLHSSQTPTLTFGPPSVAWIAWRSFASLVLRQP
jgi:uncharacterized repeat protein (TIGR01451 family)